MAEVPPTINHLFMRRLHYALPETRCDIGIFELFEGFRLRIILAEMLRLHVRILCWVNAPPLA